MNDPTALPRPTTAPAGRPSQVLILMSRTGGGHLASARALEAELLRQRPDSKVTIVDMLTDHLAFPFSRMPATYDTVVNRTPRVWHAVWRMTALGPVARPTAAVVRRLYPQLAVSLSSEVVAEMGEYPRCVTTCANAYVQPLMAGYLGRLQAALAQRGFGGSLRLMHSAGGLVSVEAASALPIRLLESGPAGGGLATALFGTLAGQTDVISFDMGGTTAKACLIEDGRAEVAPLMEAARVHRFTRGSGLPIKAPVIEMIEIGAGGGSIAAIDEVGLLKVGPRSAGSDPGPACDGV
ncbi:MAG: hydantoinase/oxoprolinase family protein, partial [Gemmatimonas sp.]